MRRKPNLSNKNSALTLLEILVTLVILGIAFAFGTPSYRNYLERNIGIEAESKLTTIYNAEKRYRKDNFVSGANSYFVCSDAANCPQEIQDNLGLIISDDHFSYMISADGNGFSVVATRSDGACSGETMTVNNSGSAVDKSACSLW